MTQLEGHSVERIYLRQRCFDASKARVAAATGARCPYAIGRVSKQMIIYPRSTFTHDFPYFRWKARVIICFVFGCNHNSYTDNKPKLNRKSEFFIIINNK